MKTRKMVRCLFLLVAVLILGLQLPVTHATAQTLVDVGYYEFDKLDGSGRECLAKDVPSFLVSKECTIAGIVVNPWVALYRPMGDYPLEEGFLGSLANIRTGSNPDNGITSAAYSTYGVDLNVDIGIPYNASSWLYKDILIDDSSGADEVVDVQISVNYDVEGGILGQANYEGRVSLSVIVEDINSGTGIGSFEVFSRDRSGDQGVTDLASGTSGFDANDEAAHFSIKLQRGKAYRIFFKAEASSAPFLASFIEASIRAQLKKLTLTISAQGDVTDLLMAHDKDIKRILRILENDHTGIENDLAVIKKLLTTPPGRRSGFNNNNKK